MLNKHVDIHKAFSRLRADASLSTVEPVAMVAARAPPPSLSSDWTMPCGMEIPSGPSSGTGLNQDGKTETITAPSALAQEALIREVYSKAGLDPAETRFFEAHGTGALFIES